MWILRSPNESINVICIPNGGPFTIGRIECDLNISDDKSVSRRHSQITFSSLGPLLNDLSSKFGTFLNGQKLQSSSLMKSGDSIKFGGATSDFMIEERDLSVFIDSRADKTFMEELKIICERFGIPITDRVRDAAYYLFLNGKETDLCGLLDADLCEALLSAKYIVSKDFFMQLASSNDSNRFSLALMQPECRVVPMETWLPRQGRLSALKRALEGCEGLCLLPDNEGRAIFRERETVSRIAQCLDLESIEPSITTENLNFNQLLVFSKAQCHGLSARVVKATRAVSFESILETIVSGDGSRIDIQTIQPEAKAKEDYLKSPINVNVIPAIPQDSVSHEVIYSNSDNGPSLISVIPCPVDFLRAAPISSSSSLASNVSGRFVKCYPKHYRPGMIPALIGPDQLRPPSSSTLASSATSNISTGKRRFLIKDSWLAEDDFVEENVKVNSSKSLAITTADHKSRNENALKAHTTTPSNITTTTAAAAAAKPKTATDEPVINANNTPPVVPTTKFQSSFFKNLSKK